MLCLERIETRSRRQNVPSRQASPTKVCHTRGELRAQELIQQALLTPDLYSPKLQVKAAGPSSSWIQAAIDAPEDFVALDGGDAGGGGGGDGF